MRFLSSLLCALALITVVACDAAPASGSFTIFDSAGVRISLNDLSQEHSWHFCRLSIVPKLQIGTTGGRAEYELYQVADVARFDGGRVAILNRGTHDVRVFSATGEYAFTIGRDGEGPGEFRDPIKLLSLPSDSLGVWDWHLQRVSVFDSGGAFVRSIQLSPAVANPTPHLFVLSGAARFWLAQHQASLPQGTEYVAQHLGLIRFDPKGQLVDTVATLPYGTLGWSNRAARMYATPMFEARSVLDALGDGFLVARGSEPELEIHDPSWKLRAIVRWRSPDRTVLPEEVDRYRRERIEAAAGSAMEQMVRRRYENVPIAAEYPAVHDLAAVPGWVWVQRYPRPGVLRESWLAFDELGRFTCTLEMPSGFRAAEFGTDYVLGVATDSLGVERVQLYHIESD